MNKELQDKLNIMKFNNEELVDKCEVLEEEYDKLKAQQLNANYMADNMAMLRNSSIAP